jgi:hypothetical protein
VYFTSRTVQGYIHYLFTADVFGRPVFWWHHDVTSNTPINKILENWSQHKFRTDILPFRTTMTVLFTHRTGYNRVLIADVWMTMTTTHENPYCTPTHYCLAVSLCVVVGNGVRIKPTLVRDLRTCTSLFSNGYVLINVAPSCTEPTATCTWPHSSVVWSIATAHPLPSYTATGRVYFCRLNIHARSHEHRSWGHEVMTGTNKDYRL